MVKYTPGYRFFPTEEELIVEYLVKKIENQLIPIDIAVVNFNDHNPDTLSGAFPPLVENEWYFFTLRNRKHQNGSRPDRTTPGGFWKATVADKPVADLNGVTVGSKRSLKFFEGTPSNKRIKTDWIMHEFIAAANQPCRKKRDANGNMKMDDLVMCRIHEKTAKSDDSNRAEHRQPLPPPLENRDVPLDVDLSEEEWTGLFDDCWSPEIQEPPHGVLLLDHLPLPPAPENRDVPPDDRLDLPLPAPGACVDLSLSDEEQDQWRRVVEVLMTEDEQKPEGFSPPEVAAKVEYFRKVLEGLLTEEDEDEQQQNHNRTPSSPPRKRARHFYDQF